MNGQNRETDKQMVEFIDLHGQLMLDAERIFKSKIKEVFGLLTSGQLKPNVGKKGHILKFICGVGKHGPGVMKERLLAMARDEL